MRSFRGTLGVLIFTSILCISAGRDARAEFILAGKPLLEQKGLEAAERIRKQLALPAASFVSAYARYDIDVSIFPKSKDGETVDYQAAPIGGAKICVSRRTTIGGFLECLQGEADGYGQSTDDALARLSALLTPHGLGARFARIDLTRDGWGERLDALIKLVPPKDAGAARKIAAEVKAKGQIHTRALLMQAAIWKAARLPDALTIAVSDRKRKAPGRSLRKAVDEAPAPVGDLAACLYAYHHSGADSEPEDSELRNYRSWNAEQTCDAIRGTELATFQKELVYLMEDSTVSTYLETLRMDAVAKFMRAHRDLVGTNVSPPAVCEPFKDGIAEFLQANPDSKSSVAFQATQSPEFKAEIQKTARLVARISAEAAQHAAVPEQLCDHQDGVQSCVVNPEHAAAAARVGELERELLGIYSAFPHLTAGSDPTRRIYSVPPMVERISKPAGTENGELDAALADARKKLSADITTSIGKFCAEPGEGGLSWTDLVSLDEIGAPVRAAFPQFKMIHDACVAPQKEKFMATRETTQRIAVATCVVGTVASSGLLGPLCGGALTAHAYVGYADARERLHWQKSCRAVGREVCDDDAFLKARAEHDEAGKELLLTAAGTLAEAPLAIGAVKGLVKQAASGRSGLRTGPKTVPGRVGKPQTPPDPVPDPPSSPRELPPEFEQFEEVKAIEQARARSLSTKPSGPLKKGKPDSEVILPVKYDKAKPARITEGFGKKYTIEADDVMIDGVKVSYPKIVYQGPANGETVQAMAERVLGFKLGKQIARGGTRRVFAHPTDPTKVIKIYDPALLDPGKTSARLVIARLIQRERGMAQSLPEHGIKVAPIEDNLEHAAHGIVVQDRVVGEALDEAVQAKGAVVAEARELKTLDQKIRRLNDAYANVDNARYKSVLTKRESGSTESKVRGIDADGTQSSNVVLPDANPSDPVLVDW